MARPPHGRCTPGAYLSDGGPERHDGFLLCDVHHAHPALCGGPARIESASAAVDTITFGYEPLSDPLRLDHRRRHGISYREPQVGTEVVAPLWPRSGRNQTATPDLWTTPT